jgi:hypothetical protein
VKLPKSVKQEWMLSGAPLGKPAPNALSAVFKRPLPIVDFEEVHLVFQ